MDIPQIMLLVSARAMGVMEGSDIYQNPHQYSNVPDDALHYIRAGMVLRGASYRPAGRGGHYVTVCDVVTAAAIWRFCHKVGDAFLQESGEDTRADGKALMKVADDLDRRIVVAGWTPPSHTGWPAPTPVQPPPLPDGDGHRNLKAIRLRRSQWTGEPRSYALVAGRGEPTRTQADMRDALTDLLLDYVGLFPDPAGRVDAVLARWTATLITIDHYAVPAAVAITREHLLKYLAVAREQVAAHGREHDGQGARGATAAPPPDGGQQ